MSNTTKKKIISLEVRDEYILGSGVAIGAVGSHASILLRIKFNENWDALNIHATWTDALGNVGEDYNQLLLPSHEVEERTYEIGVPAFATRHSGTVRLSFSGFVIGEDGEEISQILNTASGLFKVLDSNAVRLDDEQIDKNLAGQVQSELVAFGERITEFEGEMDARAVALENAENGYTDDDGNYVPGRVGAELQREINESQRISNENQRISNEKNRASYYETAFIGSKGGAPGAGFFNDYDEAIDHNRADGRASTAFGYNNQILAGHTEWCPSEFTPTEKTSYGYHGFVAGGNNKVTGYSSVALGEQNEVVGFRAAAIGYLLKAHSGRQFVCGVCNEPDTPAGDNPENKGTYAFIIGGGTTTKRKNIFTVGWDGNVTSTGTFKATNSNGEVIDLLAKITAFEAQIGDISRALDEIHAYAMNKIGGNET